MDERPTGRRRWRIGELADATGVTVRTLHHYEQVGLLEPPMRTEGRQRLYDERDAQRIAQICALRDLGLSLADIGRTLGGDLSALAGVLRARLAGVDAELERLTRLRTLLDHACVQADRAAGPDDVLAVVEAMSQVARHIDARGADDHVHADTEAHWRELGAELRACLEAGEDPSSPRVQAVARAALARILDFAGGDRATVDALATLRRLAPPENLAGWTPELFRYLDRALAALDRKEEEPC